jgi:hypothetical protein
MERKEAGMKIFTTSNHMYYYEIFHFHFPFSFTSHVHESILHNVEELGLNFSVCDKVVSKQVIQAETINVQAD